MDTESLLAEGLRRGIIDAGQRERLLALRPEPRAGSDDTRDEERFRFLWSFDDIFLSIGIVLLYLGVTGVGHVIDRPTVVAPCVAALFWIVAEIITARRRRSLPSILTFVFFAAFAAWAAMAWTVWALGGWDGPREGSALVKWSIGSPLAALVVASALFYLRFKLPFALAAITVSLIALIAFVVFLVLGAPGVLFFPILMLAGLATFALAMRFDYRDPERTTRLADCAFWLHVAAAPMIVHSALYLFSTASFIERWSVRLGTPRYTDLFGGEPSSFMSRPWLALCILLLLGIVALIVDRRALIVSGLVYFATTIGTILRQSAAGVPALEESSTAVLMLILAVLVLGIGLAWRPLRNGVVGRTPLRLLVPIIPPPRQKPA